MKKIATLAALLAALASGSALAQGLPAGFGNWQSGWPGYANARPGQGMATPKTRSHDRATARDDTSVSVVGNAQDTRRKG